MPATFVLPDGRKVAIPADVTPQELEVFGEQIGSQFPDLADEASLSGPAVDISRGIKRGAAAAARQSFEADPKAFTFEQFRRLKRLETEAGLRERRAGLAKSVANIRRATPEQLGQAAEMVGGEFVRGIPGAFARAGEGLVSTGQAVGRGLFKAVTDPIGTAKSVGRTIKQTAQDIASPEGAEAFASGVGDVTGLGTAVETAVSADEDLSPDELDDLVEFKRERRKLLGGNATTAGRVVGSAIPFIGLRRGAAGALTETGRPAASTLRQTGRAAGIGGVESAGVATSEGQAPQEVAGAGIAGTAIPPAILGTAAGLGILRRAAAGRILPERSGSVRRIAEREIADIPEDLAAAEAQLGRVVRRPGDQAAFVEGLRPAEAAQLGERIAVGAPGSVNRFQSRALEVSRGRPQRMTAAIEEGGSVESAAAIRAAASDELDRVLQVGTKFGARGQGLGRRRITLPADTTESILTEPLLFQQFPRRAQDALRAAADKNGAARIRLEDLDAARQTLNTAAKGAPKNRQLFATASEDIRRIAGRQEPDYESALQRFAEQQSRADAIEKGAGLLSKSSTESSAQLDRAAAEARGLVDLPPRLRAAETEQGLQSGVRQNVFERARAGEASSNALARDVATNRNIRTALARAFGGREAAKLSRLSKAELERGEAVGTAAAAASQGAQSALNNADLVQRVIEGVILSRGTASGGFQAAFINRLRRLAISPSVARRMAALATDPAKAAEVVRRLKRRGIKERVIANIFLQSGIAAGVVEAGQ